MTCLMHALTATALCTHGRLVEHSNSLQHAIICLPSCVWLWLLQVSSTTSALCCLRHQPSAAWCT